MKKGKKKKKTTNKQRQRKIEGIWSLPDRAEARSRHLKNPTSLFYRPLPSSELGRLFPCRRWKLQEKKRTEKIVEWFHRETEASMTAQQERWSHTTFHSSNSGVGGNNWISFFL